jgi:hypothetical protein
MRNVIAFIVAVAVLAASGCGGGKSEVTVVRQAVAPVPRGQVRVSTCGARGGFEFKLHKVDCEIANALIVMLDGRALHQSVILTAEEKRRGAWVCTSPTHSLVDRLHCRQGDRFFTVERASQ